MGKPLGFSIGLTVLFLAFGAGGLVAETGLRQLSLRNDTLGLEAVGRVDLGRGRICSGVLIAPDLVLTAGHCLFDPTSGEPIDLKRLRFRAGVRDGDSVAESKIRRAVAHPQYNRLDPDRANAIRHDVALLQLERPIPADTVPPLVVDLLDPDRDIVSVLADAKTREEGPSLQRDCQVLARHEGLMVFSCEAGFGASGAPIFAKIAGRNRVVSIVSSSRRSETETLVFGMELPGLVKDLKAALRGGRGGVILAGNGASTGLNIGLNIGRSTDLSAGGFATSTAAGGAKFLRP